jgi:hypothetical protein
VTVTPKAQKGQKAQTATAKTAKTSDEMIEAMFVQSARSVVSGDHTLTLNGLGHSTLFFADRPQRAVGHITSHKFINEWGHGENSFAEDPPNAVLAFLEYGDAMPEDVTLILRNPRLEGDSLSYTIEVLDGTLPAQAGPCSLFIDPIGRPLSPVSIAGMNRRDRRRDRRDDRR